MRIWFFHAEPLATSSHSNRSHVYIHTCLCAAANAIVYVVTVLIWFYFISMDNGQWWPNCIRMSHALNRLHQIHERKLEKENSSTSFSTDLISSIRWSPFFSTIALQQTYVSQLAGHTIRQWKYRNELNRPMPTMCCSHFPFLSNDSMGGVRWISIELIWFSHYVTGTRQLFFRKIFILQVLDMVSMRLNAKWNVHVDDDDDNDTMRCSWD